MKENIKIILLAGGKGERLWPLSNNFLAKQFLKIPLLDLSTFQLSLIRSLKITNSQNIIITANLLHQKVVSEQITELGLNPNELITYFEPEKIDTAMAIYNICKIAHNNLDQALYSFFPTDHIFFDNNDDLASILTKLNQDKINILVEQTNLISNKFGYAILDSQIKTSYFTVKKFVEKPESSIELGEKTYKNLGIYIGKAEVFLEEFHKFYPVQLPQKLSIDKAISQKTSKLNAFIIDFEWEDIGSLATLYKHFASYDFNFNNVSKSDAELFNLLNSEFKLEQQGKSVKLRKCNIANY